VAEYVKAKLQVAWELLKAAETEFREASLRLRFKTRRRRLGAPLCRPQMRLSTR